MDTLVAVAIVVSLVALLAYGYQSDGSDGSAPHPAEVLGSFWKWWV